MPCCLGPRQQTLNDEMRDVVIYSENLDELISRHQASVSLHEKEMRRLRSLMASCKVRMNQRQADQTFADNVAYLAQLIKDPSKRKLI